MSESQKEKVRLYDKQRAAAWRLEQKVSLDKKRESWRKNKKPLAGKNKVKSAEFHRNPNILKNL